MKCRNKEIIVKGILYDDRKRKSVEKTFTCIVTNDEIGKTLSIGNNEIQFTIPFEPLEKYLKD